MNPFTLAAFGGAISGATSAFLRKALDSGGKWFDESQKDHQPQAIEKANTNVMAFLELLKRKIERLEADVAGIEERLNRIRTAMDEPSFAFCFKTAMLQAALTDDSTKQTILAQLVAERLSSKTDDLYALSIQQACECMGMLTNNQLHILALHLCIWCFGYKGMSGLFPQAVRPQNVHKLIPSTIVTDLDLLHLDGVSCIHIIGDLHRVVDDLNLLVKPSEKWPEKEMGTIQHLISKHQRRLLPDVCLVLTFKGLVIGLHAYETLTEQAIETDAVLNRVREVLRAGGDPRHIHFQVWNYEL